MSGIPIFSHPENVAESTLQSMATDLTVSEDELQDTAEQAFNLGKREYVSCLLLSSSKLSRAVVRVQLSSLQWRVFETQTVAEGREHLLDMMNRTYPINAVIVDAFAELPYDEALEQLRALENGQRHKLAAILLTSPRGFDGRGYRPTLHHEVSIRDGYKAGYDLVFEGSFTESLAEKLSAMLMSASARWRRTAVHTSMAVSNHMQIRSILGEVTDRFFDPAQEEAAVEERLNKAGKGGAVSTADGGDGRISLMLADTGGPDSIDTHPHFVRLQAQYDHVDKMKSMAIQEVQTRGGKISHLEEQVAELSQKNATLTADVASLTQSLQKAVQRDVSKDRTELIRKRNIDTKKIKSLETTVKDHVNHIAELTKEVDRLDAKLDDVETALKTANATTVKLNLKIEALKEAEEVAKKRIHALRQMAMLGEQRRDQIAIKKLKAKSAELETITDVAQKALCRFETTAMEMCDADCVSLLAQPGRRSSLLQHSLVGGQRRQPSSSAAAAPSSRSESTRSLHAAASRRGSSSSGGGGIGDGGGTRTPKNPSFTGGIRGSSHPPSLSFATSHQPTPPHPPSSEEETVTFPPGMGTPPPLQQQGGGTLHRRTVSSDSAGAPLGAGSSTTSLVSVALPPLPAYFQGEDDLEEEELIQQTLRLSNRLGSDPNVISVDDDDRRSSGSDAGSRRTRKSKKSASVLPVRTTVRKVSSQSSSATKPKATGLSAASSTTMRTRNTTSSSELPSSSRTAARGGGPPATTATSSSFFQPSPSSSSTRGLKDVSRPSAFPSPREPKSPSLRESADAPSSIAARPESPQVPDDFLDTTALSATQQSLVSNDDALPESATTSPTSGGRSSKSRRVGGSGGFSAPSTPRSPQSPQRDRQPKPNSPRASPRSQAPPSSHLSLREKKLKFESRLADIKHIALKQLSTLEQLSCDSAQEDFTEFDTIANEALSAVSNHLPQYSEPRLLQLKSKVAECDAELEALTEQAIDAETEAARMSAAERYSAVFQRLQVLKTEVGVISEALAPSGLTRRMNLKNDLRANERRLEEFAEMLLSSVDLEGFAEIKHRIVNIKQELCKWQETAQEYKDHQLHSLLYPTAAAAGRESATGTRPSSTDEQPKPEDRSSTKLPEVPPSTTTVDAEEEGDDSSLPSSSLLPTLTPFNTDRVTRSLIAAVKAALTGRRRKRTALSKRSASKEPNAQPVELSAVFSGMRQQIETVVQSAIEAITDAFEAERSRQEEQKRYPEGMPVGSTFNEAINFNFLKPFRSPDGYYSLTPAIIYDMYNGHHKTLMKLLKQLRDRTPLTNVMIVDVVQWERQMVRSEGSKAHQANVPMQMAADTAIVARFADYYENETEAQQRLGRAKLKRVLQQTEHTAQAATQTDESVVVVVAPSAATKAAGGGVPTAFPTSTTEGDLLHGDHRPDTAPAGPPPPPSSTGGVGGVGGATAVVGGRRRSPQPPLAPNTVIQFGSAALPTDPLRTHAATSTFPLSTSNVTTPSTTTIPSAIPSSAGSPRTFYYSRQLAMGSKKSSGGSSAAAGRGVPPYTMKIPGINAPHPHRQQQSSSQEVALRIQQGHRNASADEPSSVEG